MLMLFDNDYRNWQSDQPANHAGGAIALLLGLALLVVSGAALASTEDANNDPVLGIDLRALDADGLVGPSNGKRSLSYEFCIPSGEHFAAEVRGIDPSSDFYHGSRGRIGCAADQVLVIGHTHQPDFLSILTRLADLPYVNRIEETYFE